MSNTDYPKVLYKDIWGDDIATVHDLEQEKAKNEEGYAEYAEVFAAAGSPENLPDRNAKPVVSEEEDSQALNPANPSADPDEKTKLIEEAKSLGIKANATWGIPKLKEEIEKAKAK